MSIPQPYMYASNMTDYQQMSIPAPTPTPTLPPIASRATTDHDNSSTKIRRKPGRRPNPASPAHRKEQNRAAQRAFRERKERRLHDLETTIRAIQEQHHSTAKELKKTKKQLEEVKSENWYIKGVMLTLQFMCMLHNIGIPPHSPYLSEETIAEMAKTHPHSTEAYITAYTSHNNDMKQELNADISNQSVSSPNDNLYNSNSNNNNNNSSRSNSNSISTPSPPLPNDEMDPTMATKDEDSGHHERQGYTSSTEPIFKQEDIERKMKDTDDDDDNDAEDSSSTTSAIQHIHLQLRIQSSFSDMSNTPQPSERLQMTPLQRAVAHDARIDLIPCPQMRDRLIIFRDQMDYDRCFSMLLDSAVFHGGDPTLSKNWELPHSFYGDYWFLCSKYDMETEARWRQMKNLHWSHGQARTTWSLPSYPAVSQTNHPLPLNDSSLEPQATPPSLDDMMTMMKSLSASVDQANGMNHLKY
ncbi:hypothetical protein BCR42DRAFT_355714 [Absidia repens]|uniref:BZIP domain-containing protein n=1 Tax=Absidia repens TaxID=90262 RepID=A0A1X2IA41_9FUNG|nr:hypothetical protein BCR42DRAFT_355714 [Absidia repens]